MTITDSLFYRLDISPSQKLLLIVLQHEATSDGVLSIPRAQLEKNRNLQGQNVMHNLGILMLRRDLEFTITITSHGDVLDIQLQRKAVLV